MLVSEIMTRPAVSCGVDDSLNTAARLMWDHDCGALPVTGDDGVLVGIVTDRDVCMAAYTQGTTLDAISVTSVMSKDVVTCHPGDYLAAAERLMRERQVRRIPIVDQDRRPLGMVSLNDLARYTQASRKPDGADRALVETLAAICKPRLHSTPAQASPVIYMA